eukprot:gene9639-20032_t
MGIPGLLQKLKSITRKVHISAYEGMRVGIDVYGWLHRGGYACSRELAEGTPTSKFVEFCLNMVKLLKSHGIKPILIFDGKSLSVKSDKIAERKDNRETNFQLALKADEAGQTELADSYFQKCIRVTSDMVQQLIIAARKGNIDFLISPYESDAQLAFLSKSNLIDVVITEDSDSIVYGCRRVLFKLDKEGYGDEIIRKDLGLNKDLSFLNWTDEQFKLFCCINGCDYAPKIKSIGIVTAHKIVAEHKTLSAVQRAMRSYIHLGADEQYFEQLHRALLTFKHQTVYNPRTRSTQHLKPLPDGFPMENIDFLGALLSDEDAVAVAEGIIHPYTLHPYGNNPMKVQIGSSFTTAAVATADVILEKAVLRNKREFSDLDDTPIEHMSNYEKLQSKMSKQSKHVNSRGVAVTTGVRGDGAGDMILSMNDDDMLMMMTTTTTRSNNEVDGKENCSQESNSQDKDNNNNNNRNNDNSNDNSKGNLDKDIWGFICDEPNRTKTNTNTNTPSNTPSNTNTNTNTNTPSNTNHIYHRYKSNNTTTNRYHNKDVNDDSFSKYKSVDIDDYAQDISTTTDVHVSHTRQTSETVSVTQTRQEQQLSSKENTNSKAYDNHSHNHNHNDNDIHKHKSKNSSTTIQKQRNKSQNRNQIRNLASGKSSISDMYSKNRVLATVGDFESPSMGDVVESLHRRKRRKEEAEWSWEQEKIVGYATANNATISTATGTSTAAAVVVTPFASDTNTTGDGTLRRHAGSGNGNGSGNGRAKGNWEHVIDCEWKGSNDREDDEVQLNINRPVEHQHGERFFDKINDNNNNSSGVSHNTSTNNNNNSSNSNIFDGSNVCCSKEGLWALFHLLDDDKGGRYGGGQQLQTYEQMSSTENRRHNHHHNHHQHYNRHDIPSTNSAITSSNQININNIDLDSRRPTRQWANINNIAGRYINNSDDNNLNHIQSNGISYNIPDESVIRSELDPELDLEAESGNSGRMSLLDSARRARYLNNVNTNHNTSSNVNANVRMNATVNASAFKSSNVHSYDVQSYLLPYGVQERIMNSATSSSAVGSSVRSVPIGGVRSGVLDNNDEYYNEQHQHHQQHQQNSNSNAAHSNMHRVSKILDCFSFQPHFSSAHTRQERPYRGRITPPLPPPPQPLSSPHPALSTTTHNNNNRGESYWDKKLG